MLHFLVHFLSCVVVPKYQVVAFDAQSLIVVIAKLVPVKNKSCNINITAIEHLKLLFQLFLMLILSPLLYCGIKSNRCLVSLKNSRHTSFINRSVSPYAMHVFMIVVIAFLHDSYSVYI